MAELVFTTVTSERQEPHQLTQSFGCGVFHFTCDQFLSIGTPVEKTLHESEGLRRLGQGTVHNIAWDIMMQIDAFQSEACHCIRHQTGRGTSVQ